MIAVCSEHNIMNLLRMSSVLLAMAGAICIATSGDDSKQQDDEKGNQMTAALGLRSIPVRHIRNPPLLTKPCEFVFRNETGRPFQYMSAGRRNSDVAVDISFLLYKDKEYVRRFETGSRVPYAKSLVRTVKPGGKVVAYFRLSKYRQLAPGRYEIRAKYDLPKSHNAVKEYGLTPLQFERTVMILHIEAPLPDVKTLKQRQGLRIKRVLKARPKSKKYLHVDVGFGDTAGEKHTLFFVVRPTLWRRVEYGEVKRRTIRLMRADPKAEIDTKLYHPFPESTDPVIEVHVLVTEPGKPQRYFIIDLSDSPRITKKTKLKPGTRYKLHKTKLGSVKLIPRKKQ